MKSIFRKRIKLISVILVVLVFLIYFAAQRSRDSGPKCKLPEPTATYALSSELLCGLVVAEEHEGDTYNRDLFKYESDLDSDGNWTRSEILIRDSTVEVRTNWRNGRSYVDTGAWLSPFDGKSYSYSSDVEIDHLVSLKEAWDSGAWRWSTNELQLYANDLEYPTMTVVSISLNRSKGEKDFAEWTPVHAKCWFAQMWVLIKYRWNLTIDADEKESLEEALEGGCGRVKLNLD